MTKISNLCLFSLLSLVAFSVSAQQVSDDPSPIPNLSSEWRFEITPYGWLPGLKSTLGLGDSQVKSFVLNSGQVLSDAKSILMTTAEVHKGNWGLMGDFVSATLQHSSTVPVTTSYGPDSAVAKTTIQQTILTGVVTYTVVSTKDTYLDALLGVRAIDMTTTFNGTLDHTSINRTISTASSTVDPILGSKGRYRIADSSWYIPFYADIGSGGGTTNLTWQAMAGIGKSFGSLIDASLVYRALYFDMNAGGTVQKVTMLGPQAAITFKF